jgi:hypothetical protein
MKYDFFVFLFFFNLNYPENLWDILTNAYNEPLSLNFYANNKIATGAGILFMGFLCLQIRAMNRILKKDNQHAELFYKKRNLTNNIINDEKTDDEDLNDIENKFKENKFPETEFNERVNGGCSHYLWECFKKSLNPFQSFRSN